ncbi:MAG: IS110 family RNA-guided transposase [Acidiferrobacteraceae bacterium]
MVQYTKFVGLDVHKNSIAVAACDSKTEEVRFYGNIPNTEAAILAVAKKLTGDRAHLSFVYEAGPCGYGLHRKLLEAGYECRVVAPSLIPKKSGDRVKTDRRDALMLARLHRAGELTAVVVPGSEQEAMRDLSRLREDLKAQERHLKQRLSAFLLRHGKTPPPKTTKWKPRFWSWVAELAFPQPTLRIVLQEYADAVKAIGRRIAGIEAQIGRELESWSLAPVVRALMTLRGVDTITAFTVVAELGDLSRFESAPRFMAYLGLVPSEASSGRTVRRGGITKTGNGHVRRVLVEAAWSYRFPARKSGRIRVRNEGQPPEICAVAWEAQKRLSFRYRHLAKAGKKQTVITAAVARELAGFVWAIGCQARGRSVALPVAEESAVME